MFGSEGGIDGSNMPYSYMSLPFENANELANDIREGIRLGLGKKVTVVIMDTDKTYSFRNFHFTPRPKPMNGIHSHGGVFAYVAGRMLKLGKRSTPIAVAGCKLQAEEALKISNIADKARGPGSGATVWDMAARFGVGFTGVSWDMLAKLKHKPIVIVRKNLQVNRNCDRLAVWKPKLLPQVHGRHNLQHVLRVTLNLWDNHATRHTIDGRFEQ
jgi:F420-0:gamma-glutamyl ligase-like protein